MKRSLLAFLAFIALLASFSFVSIFTSTHSPIDSTPVQSAGNPNVRVWVNTKSGVYHCPNTRWYGTTKQGLFMSQKEAQAKGYRPAYGSVCG